MTIRNAIARTLAAVAMCAAQLTAVAQKDLQLADSIVKYQMKSGGWPKNQDWLKGADQQYMHECRKTGIGSTIDNGATVQEMRQLVAACSTIDGILSEGIPNLDTKAVVAQRKRYADSFMRGLNYLLAMQMPNGGWPQFHPARKGVDYASQITFNDNAMVRVMLLLRDVADNASEVRCISIDNKLRRKCGDAFDRGVQCILNCQIRTDDTGRVLSHGTPEWERGKRTVWCQQHDRITLGPCSARAYELPSYNAHGETAEILIMLMNRAWHRDDVREAVKSGIEWLEKHALKGKRVEEFADLAAGRQDKRLIDDPKAPLLWARFYDLANAKPLFCGRDGVPHDDFSAIEHERRNGYQWFGDSPQKAIDRYKELTR